MKSYYVRIIAEIARGIARTIPDARYLELGVWKARCFNSVAPYFKDAIAVDIKPGCKDFIKVNHRFYEMTTDDYFKNQFDGKLFDLIFIDANHDIDNVKIDFDNSYKIIKENGLIILHDTYPANMERMKGCKDAYQVCEWIKINKNFNGEIMTLPFYDGITIFRKCERQLLWM